MPTTEELELNRLEEAALWLERLESGRVDRDAFERWRVEPANAMAFVKVSATSNWIDANKASLTSWQSPAPARSVTRRWWASAAAAAVVGIGGVTATGLLNGRASARTGVGERTSLSLPDGGRIDVNTDSEVFWRFDDKVRSIWLERGEVSVAVNTDERPLTLRALGQALQLGAGEYNVRLRDRSVEISILKGAGAVLSRTGSLPTKLEEGHSANLTPDRPVAITVTDSHAMEAVSAWRNDELVLTGITLAAAISEYNRYLKTKIVIDDPAISGIRLGGRFTTRNPADFVDALGASFGISSKRASDGTIHLGG